MRTFRIGMEVTRTVVALAVLVLQVVILAEVVL
jgi:hypothetical protein